MMGSDIAGASSLRARIRARERVVGSFIKTPAMSSVELFGAAGLDFGVADCEHAPIDVSCVDRMVVAASSVGMPLLVRVACHDAAPISAVLDLGCAGVMVPHIRSAQDATGVLDAVKYARGRRGFSPSGRAGGFGVLSGDEHVRKSDEESLVFAQIEDREALDQLDAIAATEDVDCLFVGPADLARSLRAATSDPVIGQAVAQVVAAADRYDKAAGIFVASAEGAAPFITLGVTVFVCGSDQSMMLTGARLARRLFEA